MNAPVGGTPAGAFRCEYDPVVGWRKRRAWWIGAIVLGLGFAGAAARADDSSAAPSVPGDFRATLGVEYSSGDYGEDRRTRIRSASLSLRYALGPWTARLHLPYLYVGGPGNVVGGTDPLVISEAPGPLRHETGLGDVVAAVSYLIDPHPRDLPLVELTAKVKFGTASEARDLGTGSNDYTALVDVSKAFGRVHPFVTAGYRWVGSASGFDLHNTWLASAGVAGNLGEGLSGGLVYDYRQAASRDSGDSHELGPYLSYRLSSHWRLGGYAYFGVSRAAAGFGVGSTLGYRW